MSEDAYLQFLIITVLVLSTSGLIVGLFWSLPDAARAYTYWKRYGPKSRCTYSFWRLVRTAIALISLAAFIGVAVVSLIIEDANNPVRLFVNRHLILAVVVGLTALVISEPISERRIDAAIEEEQGASNDIRDRERDPTRDTARDEADKSDRRGDA